MRQTNTAIAAGGLAGPLDDQTALQLSVRRAAAAPSVEAEVVDSTHTQHLEPFWRDLVDRADAPNMFMDPELVRAAAQADPKVSHRTVLAWATVGGRKLLVGIWSFALGKARQTVLPFRVLIAPACPNGHLATPVVDRTCLDATITAMLDCIANDPRLPHIIALDAMGVDTPTMAALVRVLSARGNAPSILRQAQRPRLASALDGKAYLEKSLSSSSRKKLRQHRRRLADKGALTSVVVTEPAVMKPMLEDFLQLEAAGWKGREGTAILCNDIEAAFVRTAFAAMADQGRVRLHVLNLDGKPISMQIVARAGATAFTWKTTYDEKFHDFSPGMLLLEDYTAALLADSSISSVDSCSYDDRGYMSAWTERQPIADLWITARRGHSIEFRVLSAAQRAYRALREVAKTIYLTYRK